MSLDLARLLGEAPSDQSGKAFSTWLTTKPAATPAPTTASSTTATTGTAKGQSALARELATLRGTTEGGRNDQLVRSAFNLGQLATDGELDRAEVEQALTEEALAIGLDPGETARTIKSGMDAGALNPRSARQADRPGIEVLDWDVLWADQTEERFIVRPILPERRQIAIASVPKLGKSLLMLEIAVRVSRGDDMFGHPTKQTRVLYLDFENDPRGDIRSRLQAMDYGPADLGELRYASFPNLGFLNTERGAAELLRAIEDQGAGLVVIDTLSRAVEGEENSNDTWIRFYQFAGMALRRAGVAMIRLDHTGKDAARGPRGGSAKRGDVDATWLLTDAGPGLVSLACDGGARYLVVQDEAAMVLARKSDPLRHEVVRPDARPQAQRLAEPVEGLFDPQVARLIQQLDELGVPSAAGRPTCEKALRDAGVRVGRDAVDAAIKQRKGAA